MNIPAYKPLSTVSPHSSREANLRQYGPAPKGWRWRGEGESYDIGDLMVTRSDWSPIKFPRSYSPTEYPVITPVKSKPAPKPAPTNLLRRIDDLRAKIVADQKLIVTASERLDKYAEVLKTLEGIK